MLATQVAFFVLAIASIASALGVITFKNAVHSALSLILTLLFLALFYLQLGAMFIAVVQVLIYAGAIMVLFLFVVTMLASEADDTEQRDRIPWQRWVASILGLALVGALSYLLFTGTAIDKMRWRQMPIASRTLSTLKATLKLLGWRSFMALPSPSRSPAC